MATQVKTWSTNETLTASDLNAEFSNVYSNMADLSSAQEFTGQKTFGADAFVKNGFGLTLGHTAQLTVSTGDGATDLIPELQVLGTGQADSTTLLGAFSTTATRAAAPTLGLLKSGNATIGSNTAVTDDEILGSIIAFGDDGTDYESPAAAIEFAVDGTPGTGDMPGRIVFYTTADAGETLTEALRLDASQNATFAGAISVDDTTESTSTTTGSIHTDGGLGVAKDIYAGDDIFLTSGAVLNWNSGGTTLTATNGDAVMSTNGTTAGFQLVNTHASTPRGFYVFFSNAAPDDNNQFFGLYQDSAAVRAYHYSDGDWQNHDNSYGGISDARLKQDIVDASSQWDDIKALQVRKYRFKSDVEADANAGYQLGVVAQEVELVSPGLVQYNAGTDTYGVQYSVLYMKCVKALQECMERIEALEAA